MTNTENTLLFILNKTEAICSKLNNDIITTDLKQIIAINQE